MLGQVGCLADRHKQGIVALLGMVPLCHADTTPPQSSSTVSSLTRRDFSSECLLLAEPPDLHEVRQKAGTTLVDLSAALFFSPDGFGPEEEADAQAIFALAKLVIAVFGAEHLPAAVAIAELQQEEWSYWKRTGLCAMQRLSQTPGWDTYLSWVQATLLHVIDEVLNQPQFWAAQPPH
jgi:hypothetical protein